MSPVNRIQRIKFPSVFLTCDFLTGGPVMLMPIGP